VLISKDEGREDVLEGEWNLKWTMQGTVESNTFALYHELEPEIMIKEVELTPISVKIQYEFPKQEIQEQTANGGVVNLIKDPPYIQGVILKDGTVSKYIIGSMGSDGYVQGSATEFVSTRILNEVLDPEEVDGLIFLDWESEKEYIVPLYE